MNSTALLIPKRISLERHVDSGACDACDVIVEMEGGVYYTAPFVTLPFLIRQMQLSYEVAKSLPDAPPVRYAALETPHVVIGELTAEVIEDAIDNLLALGTFATIFTQVSEDEETEAASATPPPPAKRATAEVAAVVFGQVLIVDPET